MFWRAVFRRSICFNSLVYSFGIAKGSGTFVIAELLELTQEEGTRRKEEDSWSWHQPVVSPGRCCHRHVTVEIVPRWHWPAFIVAWRHCVIVMAIDD